MDFYQQVAEQLVRFQDQQQQNHGKTKKKRRFHFEFLSCREVDPLGLDLLFQNIHDTPKAAIEEVGLGFYDCGFAEGSLGHMSHWLERQSHQSSQLDVVSEGEDGGGGATAIVTKLEYHCDYGTQEELAYLISAGQDITILSVVRNSGYSLRSILSSCHSNLEELELWGGSLDHLDDGDQIQHELTEAFLNLTKLKYFRWGNGISVQEVNWLACVMPHSNIKTLFLHNIPGTMGGLLLPPLSNLVREMHCSGKRFDLTMQNVPTLLTDNDQVNDFLGTIEQYPCLDCLNLVCVGMTEALFVKILQAAPRMRVSKLGLVGHEILGEQAYAQLLVDVSRFHSLTHLSVGDTKFRTQWNREFTLELISALYRNTGLVSFQLRASNHRFPEQLCSDERAQLQAIWKRNSHLTFCHEKLAMIQTYGGSLGLWAPVLSKLGASGRVDGTHVSVRSFVKDLFGASL